jgi:hypothetical protein
MITPNMAHTATLKVKYSDGTVKTATVTLA